MLTNYSVDSVFVHELRPRVLVFIIDFSWFREEAAWSTAHAVRIRVRMATGKPRQSWQLWKLHQHGLVVYRCSRLGVHCFGHRSSVEEMNPVD